MRLAWSESRGRVANSWALSSSASTSSLAISTNAAKGASSGLQAISTTTTMVETASTRRLVVLAVNLLRAENRGTEVTRVGSLSNHGAVSSRLQRPPGVAAAIFSSAWSRVKDAALWCGGNSFS